MEKNLRLPLGSKAGGLSYSALVFLNLIVSLIIGVIIQVFSLEGTEAHTYLALMTSHVALAVVLVLALKVAKQPAKSLLPVKTHAKYYIIALLIAFGALFSLYQLNDYVVQLFELMGYQRREDFVPDVAGWKVVPVMLVVAVAPAFLEEIFFRGILLNNAEAEVGTLRVIFISGFCFSLYHGSVEQTLYQFIIGCLLGFIAVRSRSLGPAILVHFLNNAIIIVLLACGAYDETTGALLVSGGGQIALTVVSALCLVGGIVWLVLDKTEFKPCQKGGVKTFFLWALAGVAVMIIMWVVSLFPAV